MLMNSWCVVPDHMEVARAIDHAGITPLHWAVLAGLPEMIELLLNHGTRNTTERLELI